jgi:hypothetical protein
MEVIIMIKYSFPMVDSELILFLSQNPDLSEIINSILTAEEDATRELCEIDLFNTLV